MEGKQDTNNSFDLEGKYKDFYGFHGVQLYGARFPLKLVPQLVEKLEKEVYDFGEWFDVQDNQEEENFQASAKRAINKEENVFLIEHQFTFKMEGLRKILEENESLTERLRYQLQYFDGTKNLPEIPEDEKKQENHKGVVEFDSQEIVDPSDLTIDEHTIHLSLFENKIEDLQKVKDILLRLKQLKVLFLNYNPVSEGSQLTELVESEFQNIELLNSKFTKNSGEFGIKFVNYKYNLEKTNLMRTESIRQLDLQKKEVLNIADFSVFKKFQSLKNLDLRNTEILSENQINRLLELLSNCSQLNNLRVDWETELILWKLYSNGKLQQSCPTLQSVNERWFSYGEPKQNEENIRFICQNIWKNAGNYRLVSETQMDETSYWYLNDLTGIAVQHSETPNAVLIPFLYAPHYKLEDARPCSLLWVVKDIEEQQVLSRDYLSGFNESSLRTARLSAWFKLSEEFFSKHQNEYQKKIQSQTLHGKKFLSTFKSKPQKFVGLNDTLPKKRPLNVITDTSLVTEYLTAEEFQICKNLEEADVIFLTHCFEETIRDHFMAKFCNQFPEECRIVQKHHLADTVQSILGQVQWLQPTYNLLTQMNEFVGEHKRRERQNEDNIWIIKAFNLARSVDMIVTDNLSQIIRQTETLPRLAQKYISNPVTLFNKKIDLRYIVAVRSYEPMEVFLYKVFWIRTSNNDFSNDYRSRDIYETHFTVMNYGKKLKQIHYNEFIEEFEKEYPSTLWSSVHDKIKQLVKELFMAVSVKYPGMAHPNCRGVYGMDVMIEAGTFQPKLLELTFSPDCERACKYHPHFYNDMFQLLFLNDQNHPNYEALF